MEASAGTAVVLTARLDRLVENPRDSEALAERACSPTSSLRRLPFEECVTVDGPLVTYDDCTVSGGTIDGTLSSSGDEIDFDLWIRAEGAGGVSGRARAS